MTGVGGTAEGPVGRLEAIWIKRARRGPMDPAQQATLVVGRGIEGSADHGGRRQVTIIDRAAWARAEADLGVDVDPSARRANLMTSGIELAESLGRVLVVGACRIRIGGETRPCERMEEAAEGLEDALGPEWRGGVFGAVLEGGEIAIGDSVRWAP